MSPFPPRFLNRDASFFDLCLYIRSLASAVSEPRHFFVACEDCAACLALSLPRRLDNRVSSSSGLLKIVAALKLPRPESVQTEIEERGVSIQKARRKRTHDIDNLAIIHVSSCNDVLALQEMSLATFPIELGLHSMCMSRLHALYFMLRTPMTLAPRSAFSFFACSVRITVIRVFVTAPPTHRDQSLRVCRRPRTHWYIHTVNWLVRIGTA